jgi:hypothetical protein
LVFCARSVTPLTSRRVSAAEPTEELVAELASERCLIASPGQTLPDIGGGFLFAKKKPPARLTGAPGAECCYERF